MTAEIAILNAEAIALAADSAVTIPYGNGSKILNTANKIYTLSKFHPLAIMVYNNVYFMGIPVEVITSKYRDMIYDKNFSSIDECCDNFFHFLQYDVHNISHKRQQDWASQHLSVFMNFLREQILLAANGQNAFNSMEDDHKGAIIKNAIGYYHELWKNSPENQNLSDDFLSTYITEIQPLLPSLYAEFSSTIPIDSEDYAKIIDMNLFSFTKILPQTSPNYSGIVIAGYGRDNFFPSLRSFELYGKYKDSLIFRPMKNVSIDPDGTTATVVPFAQAELVDNILWRIDPSLKKKVHNDLGHIFSALPRVIVDNICSECVNDKIKIKDTLKHIFSTEILSYIESLENYSRDKFMLPLLNGVVHLGKAELASMAENLIGLIAVKRKVSLEQESVGGPIDVAVISRKDGFVWIKRKHYFGAEFNHHFKNNYFRGAS